MGVFTRDEEELLAYDADAFWYFAGTMLFVILVPWTLLVVRGIIWPKPPAEVDFEALGPAKAGHVVRRCPTTAMEQKRRASQREAKSKRFGFITLLQLGVLLVGWTWFSRSLARLKPINTDPHTILGLTAGASLQEIKKAYRQKSLQHHPDKDRDNPLAPVIFQQLQKAYKTLTDERARRNYEKYGNPDGPSGMKVGIALHPDILLNKERQMLTLCIFFSILFGVPMSLVCCCLRGSSVSTGGVSAETFRTYAACIDTDIKEEDLPGLLAASAEAQRIGGSDLRSLVMAMATLKPQPFDVGRAVEIRDGGALQGRRGVLCRFDPGDSKCDVELWPALGIPMQRPGDKPEVRTVARSSIVAAEPDIECPFSDPPIRRNTAMIWGHLWRLHSHMSPSALLRLRRLLRQSLLVVRAMATLAAHGQTGGLGIFNVLISLVRFRRCLVQAMDFEASPLLQLPHVTTVPKDPPSFREVVSGNPAAREKILQGMSVQQRLDVESFCRHAPQVEISCMVTVSDEKDISEGDLATLTVNLLRTNLEESEAVGPVHAPYFPGPKYEEWWIVVHDDRGHLMVASDAIRGIGRHESCKMRFMVNRPGKHSWTVHALCDSYMGLDTSFSMEFEALKRNQVNREIFVHPEDARIKTLFEELMEGLQPPEEESESEEDCPPRPTPAALAAPAVAPATLPSASEPSSAPETHPSAPEPSSDSESDSEKEKEPESMFYEAVGKEGAYIYQHPEESEQLRLGSVPRGSKIRGFPRDDFPGWCELASGGDAWLRIERPEEAAERLKSTAPAKRENEESEEDGPARCLGTLADQRLRVLVQTRTPLSLVRRWLRSCTGGVTAEDVQQVREVEDLRVRLVLQEMVREQLGDAGFEALYAEAAAIAERRKQRLSKALGRFSSPNGIVWHISPAGAVHGLHQDGSRLRDKVEVTPDDKLQIGPFVLDETRTCSCIHWHRTDDHSKSWVWSEDKSLSTRVRLGLAF